MTPSEIARVQAYLRRALANDRIKIPPPVKPGAPIEVWVGEDFLGVVYRDDDEGEISYSLQVSILEEDLPPMPAGPGPARR